MAIVRHVLDDYYLAITFLITLGWQLLGFFLAYTLQVDKFTDLWGGINFFVLALITLLMSGSYHMARNLVASICVMVWSARLGGFLFFRVMKTGSDGRFDEMRGHFFKFAGFWAFQVLWVWVVSLPTVILNSPAVSSIPGQPGFGTGRDIAGLILFIIGFAIEAISDVQKYLHKSQNPPAPKNKPCTTGLWKWSRHPPYFGEILLHWSLWMLCLSPTTASPSPLSKGARQAQYAAIFSPLLTMALLMFLSGLPLAEKSAGKRFWLMSYGPRDSADGGSTWKNYTTFLSRTSILIPIPPAIYAPIPKFIKSTILFDFPFYKFNAELDGSKAVEEARED